MWYLINWCLDYIQCSISIVYYEVYIHAVVCALHTIIIMDVIELGFAKWREIYLHMNSNVSVNKLPQQYNAKPKQSNQSINSATVNVWIVYACLALCGWNICKQMYIYATQLVCVRVFVCACDAVSLCYA